MLELLGDGASFNDFLEAGGVDVVLHADAVLKAVGVDVTEPFADTLIKAYIPSVAAEISSRKLDAGLLGFIEHKLHIGEDIARILADGDAVALCPELLRSLVYGLDETELLHIAGGEGSVEVVDKGYYRFSSHNLSVTINFATKIVIKGGICRDF